MGLEVNTTLGVNSSRGLIVVGGSQRVHVLPVQELLLRGEREPVNWLRGAVARVVERELTAEPGVLKRGSGRVQKGREKTRRSGGELGARVLEVSLQLHPPVLKPGLHLYGEKS